MKKLFVFLFLAIFANSIKSAEKCSRVPEEVLPGFHKALQNLSSDELINLADYLRYEKFNLDYNTIINKYKAAGDKINVAKWYVKQHSKVYIPFQKTLTYVRGNENAEFKQAFSLITDALKKSEADGKRALIIKLYQEIYCLILVKLSPEELETFITAEVPSIEETIPEKEM